jgi:hypothetical protein
MAFVALAVTTGVLGAASAVLAKGGPHRGGNVRPCSLVGVNPVYHPQIFGNAATAREFGFVQSRDGTLGAQTPTVIADAGSWANRATCPRTDTLR